MRSASELEQQAKKLLDQQQFGPAHAVLEQWLAQEPENAEAHYLMAGAYGYTGQFPLAEKHCRQAIKLQPNYFNAIFRLANALDGQGKAFEALEYFQQAIELDPMQPHVWNNMGACQISLREYVLAEQSYRKAIELSDETSQFYYNLALALIPQSTNDSAKIDEAVKVLTKASQFKIELADQLYFDTLLGISFLTFNAPVHAEKYFRSNLEQEPDNAESYLNLALSLVAQNRESEALQSAKLAQQSCTGKKITTIAAKIAWTMGLIYLGLGEYQKAWPLYEFRWKRDNKAPRNLPKTLWSGESLEGKTLYLFHEQGFGDNLQFARYFRPLKQLGANIVYECQKPLYQLFSQIESVDKLIMSGEAPGNYDYYCPLASVPGVLGTTLDNIPFISDDTCASSVVKSHAGADSKGYLAIANSVNAKIDELLNSTKAKKRIGIFWRGSSNQTNDKRSCNLEHWVPLLKHSDLSFYSLQKDYVTEQDEKLLNQYSVTDMRPVIGDFADTAYIIDKLDLVITVDTSVAHLLGALGCKGKVLLAYASDWRWGRNIDITPWYESLQLYRQTDIGNWTSVISRVCRSIHE